MIITFAFLIGLFAAVQPARAATFTVSNTNDSGEGSLRQAINDANDLADDDIINFSLSGCPCTITLTSSELSISNNGSLMINGLGARLLSVSGNHQSRLFFIQEDVNAAISDITITAGLSDLGGGISNESGSRLTLNSSTFSCNSAAVGGGIFIRRETRTTLNNTIIANSTGGDCFNSTGRGELNASYSLIEDGLAFVNGTNSNNLTGDPLLGPLQYNAGSTQTHALLAGSIAIDAGNSTLPTDQRGFTRPVEQPNYPSASGGNGSDIGAYEAPAPPATIAQCKNGDWKDFTFPRTFKNQGDRIQFVKGGK